MKKQADNLEILRDIFRDVLDDPKLEISSDSTMKDIPGWDSLATFRLILAVEKEFAIRFPDGVFVNSVGHILDAIKNHNGRHLA